MDILILHKIRSLRNISLLPNHNIPQPIKSNIMYLDCLYSEYVRVRNYQGIIDNRASISNRIEKVLVQLIIKFSNNTMPNQLAQIFSDIIILCIEQRNRENENIDNLTNIFARMNLGEKLEESMVNLKI